MDFILEVRYEKVRLVGIDAPETSKKKREPGTDPSLKYAQNVVHAPILLCVFSLLSIIVSSSKIRFRDDIF